MTAKSTPPKHHWTMTPGFLLTAVVAICAVIGTIITIWSLKHEKTDSHDKTATANGNNSPATVQTGNASGGSTLIQAAAGSTVNNGATADVVDLLRKGMDQVQKEKETELAELFPGGYLLFSASKDEVVTQPESVITNDLLVADWKACTVKESDDKIQITPPNLRCFGLRFWANSYFYPKPVSIDTWYVLQHFLPDATSPPTSIYMGFVKTNKDALTIAIGVHYFTNTCEVTYPFTDTTHIVTERLPDESSLVFIRLDYIPTVEGVRIVHTFQEQKIPLSGVMVYRNIAYFSLPGENDFLAKTSFNIKFIANTMPAQLVQHVKIIDTNVFFDNQEVHLNYGGIAQ